MIHNKIAKPSYGILFGSPDGQDWDYVLRLRADRLAIAVSPNGKEFVIMCRGTDLFLEPVNDTKGAVETGKA